MSTRKKNSKRTGTISSRTRSVEPAIDGLGGTSQSRKRGRAEAFTDAQVANRLLEIKKRKQTIESRSSILLKAFEAGMCTCNDCTSDWKDFRSCVLRATASKLEPKTSSESSLGLKHDSEKPMLAYIPKAALDAEGKAFAYGAKKYEAFNYKHGLAVTRTLSGALRHIIQFLDGEDIDVESGVNHLGCARANLAMALDTLANHPTLDDRFKGNK